LSIYIRNMARAQRKHLADMRALEEEAERENPLDGRGGATPSMGLSQVRGGGTGGMNRRVGAGRRARSVSPPSGCGTGGYLSGRYEGKGEVEGGIDYDSEKVGAGTGGMKVGGFLPLAALLPILAPAVKNMLGNLTSGKNVITGKGKDMEGAGFLSNLGIPIFSNLAGMFGLGHGEEMKGGFLPLAALLPILAPAVKNMLGNLTSGKNVITGKGKYMKGGLFPLAMLLPMLAPAAGKMLSNLTSGKNIITGEGKPKKSELSKILTKGSDRRSARAHVVKRVMAEKGLSMINASKYVKEHQIPY